VTTPAPAIDTVTFDGRPLTPGETFAPFPEHPAYAVTYLGTHHNTIVLSDSHGAFGCPADALPFAARTERSTS
jgi:hypothetical protein